MSIAFNGDLKFAQVNATADGVNTVVAAVASKRICVIGYCFTFTAAGLVVVQDNTGTPVVLGRFTAPVNGQVDYAGGLGAPAFFTSVGKSLDISNAAGVDTLGHLCYLEID